MKKFLSSAVVILAICGAPISILAQTSPMQVLAFYSTDVEADHVAFAKQAIEFYKEKGSIDGFSFEATSQWDDLNADRLKQVRVVLWLDDFPHTNAQRSAFETYMKSGGGWLGFHIAAYNDADTHWPWFVDFLGGGVFYGNNWPPLPARLNVDNSKSPITQNLPKQFMSPANEWYSWKPSPRANKDVEVLITLDDSNYPLGFKDTLVSGDVPVVWRNTRYRMIYMNMGHGDRIFTDKTQNLFLEDSLKWLLNGAGKSAAKPQ